MVGSGSTITTVPLLTIWCGEHGNFDAPATSSGYRAFCETFRANATAERSRAEEEETARSRSRAILVQYDATGCRCRRASNQVCGKSTTASSSDQPRGRACGD